MNLYLIGLNFSDDSKSDYPIPRKTMCVYVCACVYVYSGMYFSLSWLSVNLRHLLKCVLDGKTM